MKKYIIYFLIIFTAYSIYCKENTSDETTDLSKNIYLNINFDYDMKINGKIVINDLTADVPRYLRSKDTTDDMLKSNKYIYKSQDLKHYKDIENVFSQYLKDNLDDSINDKNFNVILNDKENDTKSGIIINLSIFDYTEGEYNLISNRQTNIKFLVKINKKDSKTNLFLLQVYNYYCKSDLINPTEDLRFNFISKKFVKDLYKKLINYKVINEKRM
jgi:hypothetical protein